MRFMAKLALLIGKLALFLLKITGHGGTFMPGKIALSICPDFLKYINCPKKIIAVTGTNGKTTVTNLLVDLLEADGRRVLSNRQGANEKDGIATMFIAGENITGRCRHEFCVVEVDEISSYEIFKILTPQLLIVTNLSRDTIERDGHTERVRNVLNAAIPKDTILLLNADDLFSAFLSPENKRYYFGLDSLKSDPEPYSVLVDGSICPNCNKKLVWKEAHYSDIGRAFCQNCGLKLPDRDYLGTNVDNDNMTFELSINNQSECYRLPDFSVFNIYNIISVISALHIVGYELKKIADLLQNVGITQSRFGKIKIGNRTVVSILTKEWNPSASSRIYEYIHLYKGKKEIVFMNTSIRELSQIYENVAWLYDSNAELLSSNDIVNIILYGARTLDQTLRLLIAGVPKERIRVASKPQDIADNLIYEGTDVIFILFGIDCYQSNIKEKVEKSIIKRLKEEKLS